MAKTSILNQVFNNIFVRPTAKQFPFIITIAAICFGSLVLSIVSIPFLKPAKKLEIYYAVPSPDPFPREQYPATLELQISPEFQNNIPAQNGRIGIDVIIDTGGEKTIGADAVIYYDNSLLEFIDYRTDKDITYDSFIVDDYEENMGVIEISGYSLDKVEPLSNKILASLLFDSKGVTGQTYLTLAHSINETKDSNVSLYSTKEEVSEKQERDILGLVKNLTINIVNPPPSPPPTPKPCVQEGKVGFNMQEDFCCSGLEKIYTIYDPSNNCFPTDNDSFVCTKCGNGECGLGENYCNCSKDCLPSPPPPSPPPTPVTSLSPPPSPSASPSASPSPSIIPLACHYNADLNLDGLYNSADLSILVSQWGVKNIKTGCHIDTLGNSLPNEDLNSDTTVNSIDIQVFVPWYNPESY